MSLKKSLLIVLLILIVDQVSKVYIKLNFPLTLYGQLPLFDLGWFKLLFIENKGMAWGATINDFLPFISERSGCGASSPLTECGDPERITAL